MASSMKWKKVVFDVVLANGKRTGRESILFPAQWLEGDQANTGAYLETHIKDYLRHVTYEIKSIHDEV